MNNLEKACNALNALAEKWCGVQEAFTDDDASKMLQKVTAETGNEDYSAAYLSMLGYGLENITLKDFSILTDYRLKFSVVKAATRHLLGDREERNLGCFLQIMCHHWADLNSMEKDDLAEAALSGISPVKQPKMLNMLLSHSKKYTKNERKAIADFIAEPPLAKRGEFNA